MNMQSKININIAVDVIAALSEKTLHNHIFMMDNSIHNSSCQGSQYLTTNCQAGQMIHWVIYAIDLQTPVAIRDISFGSKKNYDYGKVKTDFQYNIHDYKEWTGIVPWYMAFNIPLKYTLEIQMGEGTNSIMSIDTPCLMRV